MPIYTVRAINPENDRTITTRVEATDQQEAEQAIRDMGLRPAPSGYTHLRPTTAGHTHATAAQAETEIQRRRRERRERNARSDDVAIGLIKFVLIVVIVLLGIPTALLILGAILEALG